MGKSAELDEFEDILIGERLSYNVQIVIIQYCLDDNSPRYNCSNSRMLSGIANVKNNKPKPDPDRQLNTIRLNTPS
jgi:hypothetical protein